MNAERVAIDPTIPFEEVDAADRRRIVIEHVPPSLIGFFPVVSYVGVVEWITRPAHRLVLLLVGALYVLIAGVCLVLLRRRPQWAVPIAVGGVSALCVAMLSYSPLVRGNGELCVLAMAVLLGGFTVMFPVGLRNQLLASLAPILGYATVLHLGTTTAFPAWYSGSALLALLFVLAVGAHAFDRYRSRILQDAFRDAALAAENARLRDAARAADRAKSDLMAMLSHELRTPLGTIRNFSELLLAGAFAGPNEWRTAVQHLRDQSNRAVDLVQTMLEFGSIESGRLQVSVEEFDVAEMLDRLRGDLPTVSRPPNVQVFWQGPLRGLLMRTDRGKIEAIVRNLLHNALRHTTDGSVSVTATMNPAGKAVCFAVTDTGEGISEDVLPHIFERFARATSAGGGFGLGLFIVKRFAAVLGGEVRVESTPGVGTRFEAVVPVEAPALLLEGSVSRAA